MKNYYVLSNGRVKREQNTLVIEQQSTGVKRPIPVEDVESLYVFGEVDVNSKVLNFLAQKRIPLHLFNYYGHYSGTFHPREYLHSGYLAVQQALFYADSARRMTLARETVNASAHSILRTLAYYVRRKPGAAGVSDGAEPAGEIVSPGIDGAAGQLSVGPTQLNDAARGDQEGSDDAAVDILLHAPPAEQSGAVMEVENESGEAPETLALPGSESAATSESGATVAAADSLAGIYSTVERLSRQVGDARDVDALRGVEGKMRERYYAAWRHILIGDWSLERRVRRPPDNELNALISFGNGWLYTVCVGEIYRTQLLPTIAYLHEPGERRFSLALDLSELFKPLIVDRVIFKLINNRQIEPSHFDKTMDGCWLSDGGKQLYLRELEAKLATTIRHRRLRRHVSYRHLIRLECYKLVRHLTSTEPYHAFRAWW